MIGKLEVYGIVLIVVLLAMAGAYFKGHHAGAESVQVKWDAAINAQREHEQKQANLAVTKKESGDAKAKVVYRTITQTVDKLVDRPVYRNVCFDADGVKVANEALTGSLSKNEKKNPK